MVIINLTGREIWVQNDLDGQACIFMADKPMLLVHHVTVKTPMGIIGRELFQLPDRQPKTLFLVNPEVFEKSEGREDIITVGEGSPSENYTFLEWCSSIGLGNRLNQENAQVSPDTAIARFYHENATLYDNFRIRCGLVRETVWDPIPKHPKLIVAETVHRTVFTVKMSEMGFYDVDDPPRGKTWYVERQCPSALLISDKTPDNPQRLCYLVNRESIHILTPA